MLPALPATGHKLLKMLTKNYGSLRPLPPFFLLLVVFCSPFFSHLATAQAETRVIILGTGTPVPDANRSGPGVAVITNGEAYVFDAGGGMVKKMRSGGAVRKKK